VDKDSEPIEIDLLDSTGDKISAHVSNDMKEQKKGEWMHDLQWVPEDQNISELWMTTITDISAARNSPGGTDETEEHDVEI
jgi:hypothetical protein